MSERQGPVWAETAGLVHRTCYGPVPHGHRPACGMRRRTTARLADETQSHTRHYQHKHPCPDRRPSARSHSSSVHPSRAE